MKLEAMKTFSNGCVSKLRTSDGYPVEVTDTFLPFYTKDAIGRKQNSLCSCDLGSRRDRWMIGVSTMSGCPVGCKFCATGKMGRYRNLTGDEIVEQVEFVKSRHVECFGDSRENKINYTRMGEPFLNIDSVRNAIDSVNMSHPGVVHHYVSTIGVRGSDFSWIEGNITLQISLHSLDEERRNWLIPFSRKMSIEELGQIRTRSNLKTTVNLTLVDRSDFDIDKLRKYFDPDFFFIKISPINTNDISDSNGLGSGVIEGKNIL